MKKTIISISVIIGLSIVTAAFAQSQESQPVAKEPSRQEQQYKQCMSVAGCPLEVALALLGKVNEDTARSIENIHDYCKEMNYTGCITPQSDEFHLLKRSYDQAVILAKKIEAGGLESPPAVAKSAGKQ